MSRMLGVCVFVCVCLHLADEKSELIKQIEREGVQK